MGTSALLGRIILSGDIHAVTGLRIGGAGGSLSIGNVDLPVIRNSMSGKPYIPGSSLKGKMRSLSEKLTAAPQNTEIGKEVRIHVAKTRAQYDDFWVNPLFGVPGSVGGDEKYDIPAPNRLIVRDVALSQETSVKLEAAKTDLPYTEVKWEAAIDRVTSAATPRQIERVPAGAIFSPMELVFSVYLKSDVALFRHLLTSLSLVQDDYLGGHGSRGSGKVAFENLKVECRGGSAYGGGVSAVFKTLADLINDPQLDGWLAQQLKLAA